MQGWKKELCSVQPKELEQLNRSEYIQRKNIVLAERAGMDGEPEFIWECECRIVTMDEYRREKSQEEVLENQAVIMLALADLYESNTGR